MLLLRAAVHGKGRQNRVHFRLGRVTLLVFFHALACPRSPDLDAQMVCVLARKADQAALTGSRRHRRPRPRWLPLAPTGRHWLPLALEPTTCADCRRPDLGLSCEWPGQEPARVCTLHAACLINQGSSQRHRSLLNQDFGCNPVISAVSRLADKTRPLAFIGIHRDLHSPELLSRIPDHQSISARVSHHFHFLFLFLPAWCPIGRGGHPANGHRGPAAGLRRHFVQKTTEHRLINQPID